LLGLYLYPFLSGHAAYPRVAELAYDLLDGSLVQHRVGVGEDHVGGLHVGDGPVQGGGLSLSPRLVQYGDLRVLFQSLIRVVIASIGDPDQSQLIRRIIQLSAIHHLARHDRLLVVGGYQQRGLRQRLWKAGGPGFYEQLLDLDHKV